MTFSVNKSFESGVQPTQQPPQVTGVEIQVALDVLNTVSSQPTFNQETSFPSGNHSAIPSLEADFQSLSPFSSLTSKDAKKLLNVGMRLSKRNPHAAIEKFKKGLAIQHHDKPLIAGLHLKLGATYQDLGMAEAAIDEYKKGLKIEHNDPFLTAQLYCNLGDAYRLTKKFDEAILVFQTSLSIKHENNALKANIHYQLGSAYYEINKLDDAILEYKKGLKIEHQHSLITAFLHYRLGFVYKVQDNLNAAINEFKQCLLLNCQGKLAIEPIHLDLAYAYKRKGSIYKKEGDLSSAIDTWKNSLTYRPDQPEVHFLLATAFREQGNLKAALHHLHESHSPQIKNSINDWILSSN